MKSFDPKAKVCISVLTLAVVTTPSIAQVNLEAARTQANQIQRQDAANQRELERRELIERNTAPGGTAVGNPAVETRKKSDACIDIKEVEVSGVTLFPIGAIDRISSSIAGTCSGLADFNNVLKQLTNLYLKKGYVTSRAFLPEQDLTTGVLKVVVVEGHLEDIKIEDEGPGNASRIATAFPGLKGKTANLRDIEQGLDQLNRLQSNNATIELEPGQQEGSSVLKVKRNKGKPWSISHSLDNYGSSSTGEYQNNTNVVLEDVFAINEKWNFGFNRSMTDNPFNWDADNIKSEAINLGVSIPYGYWTFDLTGSTSRYKSELASQFANIPTSGSSRSASIKVGRVIHRDQVSKTSVSSALNWKQNENFILGSRIDTSSRSLTIANFDVTHSRQFFKGQLLLNLGYQHGLDWFGAFNDKVAPAGSPKGQFEKFTGTINYSRNWQLGESILSYSSNVDAQWSDDLLFGSEQAAYGSNSTVRGVRDAILSGNKAVLLKNEVSFILPRIEQSSSSELFGRFELYGAIDYGHVAQQPIYSISGGDLAGATIGFRNRSGKLNFDFAYSKIFHSSQSLSQTFDEDGLLMGRVSLSF